MKLFKNKKGSVLVERILMVAFSVAAGGAVIVYGSNVITNAKNTQITGILGNSGNGQMTQEQIDEHFNDSTKTVSFSVGEISGRTLSHLLSYIQSLDCEDDLNSTMQYGEETIYPNNDMSDESGEISWTGHNWGASGAIVHFIYDFHPSTYYTNNGVDREGCFYFGRGSHNQYQSTSPECDFTWTINNHHYEQIKQALIFDLA